MARSSTSFGPGNLAAARHGLQSAAVTGSARARVRAEIRDVIREALPYLTPADAPLLDLAVDVISDLRQLREYIDTQGGLVDLKGKPLGCGKLYGTLLRQAVAIFDRLGIGPASRASLMGSLGTAATYRKQQQQQLAVEAHKRLQASMLEAEDGQ